jgi:hypothetical protein
MVEPTTEDVSKIAYKSERIQRIETMLVDLDKMAAARIAANGGTPDNTGVVAASVETTTVTTTPVTPMIVTVTTPAVISEWELVKAIEERVVANEIGNDEHLMFIPQHRDLTTTDITFMREGKMKVWW